MKRLSVIIVLLLSLSAFSQTPAWEWARTTGGPGKSWFYGAEVSPDGNIYVTGAYNANAGYITFGPDTLLPCSIQWPDIFLAKLTPSGNVLWTKTFCGFGDESGNIIPPKIRTVV